MILGGIFVAKQSRYKQMEELLTRVLLADVAVFALYLIFAGSGSTALKAITAIIAILLSGLCLAFLYMNGEIKKRRSRWMVMGYSAVLVCLLVSLLVNYPSPAQAKATPAGSVSTSPTDTAPESTASIGGADNTALMQLMNKTFGCVGHSSNAPIFNINLKFPRRVHNCG